MEALVNDRWRGSFMVTELGRYRYTVLAWVDHFKTVVSATWRSASRPARMSAVDLLIGAEMVEELPAGRPPADDAGWLGSVRRSPAHRRGRRRAPGPFGRVGRPHASPCRAASSPRTYDRELDVVVDRRARPLRRLVRVVPALVRAGARPPRHLPRRRETPALRRRRWASTCSTCRRSIPSARASARAATIPPTAGPDDPGSPWAIGSAEGGHKAIHPQLGTLDDFRHLVAARRGARHRDRAGHRLPVRPRSSLCHGASRVVPPAARRHDPVRRESAQEVPGHLSVRLRDPRIGGSCGTS